MSTHSYNRQGWKQKKSFKERSPLKKIGLKRIPFKNIVLIVTAGVFAGLLALLGFVAFISRDLPNPNSLTQRSISQTTKIYDRTGTHVLYEIFGDENRTLKQLQTGFCGDSSELELDASGIPLFVVQATIAAEDHSFCQHGGFDFKGLGRAVIQNLMGNRVGGSTLTQQLVKNAILSGEKTLTRKTKELILSVELERRYTKDEMLQIYLNEIPYGSTYYGIEAASQNYYKKSVNELTLAQAATLAALPKATTFYLNNADRLQARRDYILGEMLDLDFITQDEHDAALLENTPVKVSLTNIYAPHFVHYVKEQLEETYGPRAVEEGGLKVITTLDYDKQKIAEEEVLKGVDTLSERYGFSNGALVALDPKTGQILAMVGSKDYFDDSIDGQVNVATRLRQPGSSFKPIVYTKAFEMGYTPNTILWDVETTFPTVTGNYTPHNYDGGERGPLSMRKALQGSLNIPAVKTVYLVGVENTLNFATSLGYSSFSNHSAFGLSVVLGGGEVKLLEHVNAYATFANEGIKNETVSLLRIEDSDGTILEEWKPREGKKILNKNVTRMITDVLKDNNARSYVFGPNSYLQLGERPVATKTGTTNDYRDAWTVGYTPSLVVGVWTGNNDNSQMTAGADGSVIAAPIWNGFMRRALEGTPIETFNVPEIKATGKAVLDGQISSKTLVIDKASGKLATEYTPDSYKEERIYAEYHSILHYVNPKDPTGEIPQHLEEDPNYTAWETAVQNWIQKKQQETGIEILSEPTPTQEDDLHVPSNFPSVKITSPEKNEEIDSRSITIAVSASAPRGVVRTEFFINGQYLGSDDSSPFSLSSSIPSSISRGVHTLKVIAYDDIENVGTDTVSIQINSEGDQESLELIDPKNGQTIERTKNTYTIVVSLENPELYQSVSVYSETLGNGVQELIGQIQNPGSPFLTFEWILPESGNWALSARAVSKTGSDSLSTAGSMVKIIPSAEQKAQTTQENSNQKEIKNDEIKLF